MAISKLKQKPKRAVRKAAPRAQNEALPPAPAPGPLPVPMFPIVGIGASARGLDPLRQLLRSLGDAPAAAIVVVMHREKQQSGLDELLSRATTLPVNDDLQNLLSSLDLSIVMLDSALRIRRFNPRAQRTLELVSADVGRPIDYLRTTLVTDAIEPLIRAVIENLEVREVEVSDRRGQRYALRVRPYKTADNRIEGAVLVLIDR